MKRQDFRDVFVLFLFGLTEKDGSVKWKDEDDNEIFITFPTLNWKKAVVKKYYENGNIECEEKYKNGLLHGKRLGWYENGIKFNEETYKNGIRYGVCTT